MDNRTISPPVISEITGMSTIRNVTCMNESRCQLIDTLSGNEIEEMYKYLRFEELVRYIIPTLFAVIVLSGFVGNVLVIFVVWSYKQMQNTTNILIVSLAFADLFFIIFCVPFTAASYAMTVWPFGDVWCKIVWYLTHVCAYASVWTLVLMSLDRYLAIVHPIASIRIRNRRNTYLLVYITWTIICCGNTPILIQYGVAHYQWFHFNRSACINLAGFKDKTVNQTFYACFFAFGYVIPLVLICILYGFLLKRLLYGVVPGGSQRADSIRAKKKVTRMVIIVVLIFALCWLPIQVVFLLQNFTDFTINIESAAIMMAANCLSYMNSCVNPILYVFLSENFRRSFRRIIFCLPEPFSKHEFERTNLRGLETRESLLTGSTKCKTESSNDKNHNSGDTLEMKNLTHAENAN